jgi:AraC-like DNA-binding protein
LRADEPNITIRAVVPIVRALECLGHPVRDILDAAGVPSDVLDDPDGRIPHSRMMRLWDEALAASGDPDLGIHVAEAAPVESFEVHAYAFLSSPTPRDAYRRACRYQRLIHEATDLVFDEGDDEGVIRHALPGGFAVPRHPAESLAALWLRFGRLAAAKDWRPNRVRFAHEEPPETAEHRRVFMAPIEFASGVTALHVPNDVLDVTNPGADPGLTAVLDRYAGGLLERSPRGGTLTERVRARMLDGLEAGAPGAETIAEGLHMSVRSLHRGLRAEGTAFREVLDQLRHERATRLLADPRCSVSEVAFLLGFSENSSFSRAFKRWTGRSPAEYRARLRS